MSQPAIRVEGLSKQYRIGTQKGAFRYGSLRDSLMNAIKAPFRRLLSASTPRADFIWALKDVSFEVQPGEVMGIIGRNGAGKTTLLKVLARITEPTEGRAEIRGCIGSLLEVGTGFHPELTGRENIYLNGAVLGMKRREINRKFDEIVQFTELEKFLDTPVKRYSSGMYVRLAFSVAAHLDPEILFVDEVLAVGDAAFQKKCIGKMDDVAKGGRTVLFVSHNMFSVENLCTRGILIESGQIIAEDNTAIVIGKYLESRRGKTGEVCWASPDATPGNERVRLRAVRVVSEDGTTGEVDISKEFGIEVDYWNIEPDRRRLVSIHLHNSMGICVLTSGNLPSASLTTDPWYFRRYPRGLFRTSCTIPGCLLNDGLHSISVYINEKAAYDNIVLARDVLSFTVRDTGVMREEYTGKWVGAVRPRLGWQTTQLS